ncbi:MAG: ice-binding family protein [Candidatus Gracilibacteria bacterium]|nr:ice-binding family protein [Candidatus Gracilibacteria bacterium]MDD2908242.1 ice-binding family protein [Candidatus Gracilibacteria bacterium]
MFKSFIKKSTSLLTVSTMLFSFLSPAILYVAFAAVNITGNTISGGNNSFVNLTNSGSYPITFTFSGLLDAGDIVHLDIMSGSTLIKTYTGSQDLSGSILFNTDLSSALDGDLTFSGSVYASGATEAYSSGITSTGTADFIKPTQTIIYSGSSIPVIATLTGETVIVTNNSGSLVKSFASNGTFTFDYIDAAGNTGSTIATVSSIAATVSPEKLNLLSAGNFVILAESEITDVPTSVITGNIGISPAAGSFIGVPCSEVIGMIYAVDAAFTGPCETIDSALLTTAVNDMHTAYTDAAGRTNPTATELGAGDISGLTLSPGLYKWGTNVDIFADITLSGSATDVWIFQIEGNLNLAPSKKILLSGGANASNIFWQVKGDVLLDTGSIFNGTILSKTLIALNTGAVLNGRALAQTAVTLQSNIVNAPLNSSPNPFTFTPQTNVELSTDYNSIMTIAGINIGTTISITGGQYMIGTGSFTGAVGIVNNGDIITVKITSSTLYSTATSLTLTIGGVNSIFTVTTKSAPSTGGGGGGGGGISIDYCPSGDTSLSYYDGTCGKTIITTDSGTIAVIENIPGVTTNTIITASGITTEIVETATGITTTITTDSGKVVSFTPKFTDITNSFAIDDIKLLINKGIIKGYSDGTFRPNGNASRAEFLGMTMKSFNIPLDSNSVTDFTDIPSDGTWMIKYIVKAKELGIMNGQNINGKLVFRPNDAISRGEAIAILLNVAKISSSLTTLNTQFTDIPTDSAWMIKYIEKAKELGIMNGQTINGKLVFRPNDAITRAEVATIIVKALGI